MKTAYRVHPSTMKQIDAYLKKDNPGGLILLGMEHLGKFCIAEEIARVLLCTDSVNGNPCGTCASCMTALSAHSDYEVIVPDKNVIKVEQIRAIIERSKYSSVMAKQKVFVIDDADSMTPDAQDTLLKLLEDGNKDNIIILVAHKPLANTIHSRCSVVNVYPVTEAAPKDAKFQELIDYAITDGKPGLVGKMSDDSMAYIRVLALTLSNLKERKEIMDCLCAIKEKDKNYVYDCLNRDEMGMLFSFLRNTYLSVLYYHIGAEVPESAVDIAHLAQVYTLEEVVDLLEVFDDHEYRYRMGNGKYSKNDFFCMLQMMM